MSLSVPSIGSDVYVPTIEQYFIGGRAKVIGVVGNSDNHHIVVEEHSGSNYAWERGIALIQDELRNQFRNQRAYATDIPMPCPLRNANDNSGDNGSD